MNMKKTLAGVLASVVAVSAMATVAVSAVETEQKAENVVFDLTKKGWQVTYTASSEMKGGTSSGWTDVGVAKDTFYKFDKDVEITITGKSADGASTLTKTYTVAKDKAVKVVSGDASNPAAEGDINLGLWTAPATATPVVIKVATKETLPEDPSEASAKADAEDATKTITVTGTNCGTIDGSYSGASFGPVKSSPEAWAAKGSYAKMEDKGVEFTFDDLGAYQSISEIKGNLGYNIISAIGNKKGAKIAITFGAKEKLGEIGSLTGPSLDYNKVAAQIKDLAIAPARTTVVPKWDNLKGKNVDVYTTDFSGKVQGAADIKDNVATFDWDAIVAGSGLNINSLGLVNDLVIGHKTVLNEADRKYVVEKVEVIIPAKTFDDLSAGEGQAESEETLATSAADEATTDATTAATEEAANPSTGNAPIALAVIPVAIAAAAIVAKKRG